MILNSGGSVLDFAGRSMLLTLSKEFLPRPEMICYSKNLLLQSATHSSKAVLYLSLLYRMFKMCWKLVC